MSAAHVPPGPAKRREVEAGAIAAPRRSATAADATLVLVHGIVNTSRIFRPLVRSLEAGGIRCLTLDLKPNHGGARLETLAAQVAAFVDAHAGPGRPVHLLGFSMGALVSRWYLQELDGMARCRQFISVAAPHHGTHWSWLGPLSGMRQMRPRSAFLRHLEAGRERLLALPVTCYWTPWDLVVIPAHSATLPGATNISVNSLCHQCLLRHPTLMEGVRQRVIASEAATPSSQ